MTTTDANLEQRVTDAIGHFFGGNGDVALTRREAARAVLAITESDKAEAVARARSVALNDAAGALSVLSSGTPTHIERETAKGVLHRLADEAVTTTYALAEQEQRGPGRVNTSGARFDTLTGDYQQKENDHDGPVAHASPAR